MMFLSDDRSSPPCSILSFYKIIKNIKYHSIYNRKLAHETKTIFNYFLDGLGDMNVRNKSIPPVRKLCFNPVPSTCIKFKASTCVRPKGSYETRQHVKKVHLNESVEIQFLDSFKKHVHFNELVEIQFLDNFNKRVRFNENILVKTIPARDGPGLSKYQDKYDLCKYNT